MATNYTENYQLNQWEPTDKVLRTEFNADNQKIDAALGVLAQTVATTAEHAGNCKLWVGSYTGTGTYDMDHKCSFTFPDKPTLVIITAPDGRQMILPYGMGTSYVYGDFPAYATWSGNTMTWYALSSAANQMNTKDRVYSVLALINLEV